MLSCGAYNRYAKGQIPTHEHTALFCEKTYFSPWAWDIARDRWASIRSLWSCAAWDSAMESRIMPALGLVNYRSVHSHVQCIGRHGVHGARAAACTFYTTQPVETPIDYAVEPRLHPEGLPEAYWHPLRDDAQIADPNWRSEWDRKLLPRIWRHAQKAMPPARRGVRGRWRPFSRLRR